MKKTIYTLIAALLICTSSYAQWQQANGPYGGDILCLMNMGSTIYAGTENGVYKSTNSGISWTFNGLPDTYIYSVDTCLGNIYLGTDNGVYKSSFAGGTWTAMNMGLINLDVLSIAITPTNKIFAGTWGDGVFISSNFGATWVASTNGMTSYDIMSLAVSSQGFVFAGTETGVFGTGFSGTSWTEYNMIWPNTGVNALAVDGQGNILAGCYQAGVCRSTDHGITWSDFNTGLSNTEVQAVAIGGDGYIYAGTKSAGVYVCKNIYNGWATFNGGITDNTSVTAFSKDGTSQFTYMGTTRGVFHGSTLGWTEKNNGMYNTNGRSMAVNSSGSFVVGTDGQGVFNYQYNNSNGTYYWAPLRSFVDPYGNIRDVNAIAVRDTNTSIQAPPLSVFAGTNDGTQDNVYRCESNGYGWTSWLYCGTGFNGYSEDLHALEINKGNGRVFAGTWGSGVYFSSDNGNTWYASTNGLAPNARITSFGKIYGDGKVFVGTYDDGMYISQDNGVTWAATTVTGASSNHVSSFARNGTEVYVGTSMGVVFSPDNGITWLGRSTGLTNTNIRAMAMSGTAIFAATSTGVFLSINKGLQWNAVNTGLSNTNIWSMVTKGTDVFVGTIGSGVWTRPISQMVIGIEEYGDYSNFNIYPNPSNGIFKFDIENNKSGKINLEVINILGEKVYAESYGNQQTSNEIDLSSSPKGIYFVKIQEGDKMYSKKIVVQ